MEPTHIDHHAFHHTSLHPLKNVLGALPLPTLSSSAYRLYEVAGRRNCRMIGRCLMDRSWDQPSTDYQSMPVKTKMSSLQQADLGTC